MRLLTLFCLLVFSCQQETPKKEMPTLQKSSTVSNGQASSQASADDFSDLAKKDDESCDTEEDLEKKIQEKIKKKEAFKLQGGDSDCTME